MKRVNIFDGITGLTCNALTERSKQKSVSRKDAKDAKKIFTSWF